MSEPWQGQFAPQPAFFTPRAPEPPPKKPVKLWVLLSLLVVAVLAAVTWLIVETSRTPSRPATSAAELDRSTKTVTAEDGRSAMTVPAQWVDLPSEYRVPGSVLALGQVYQERYLMVVSDDKADFKDFADYEETAEIALTELSGAVVGQPVDVTLGGMPAVRYEVNGTFDDVAVVYWCTVVEGERAYHQILTWTLADRRAASEPALREVVDTFREK
ncbi:hypothetical protein SAMN05192558_109223 [Actinokineospora alba]|uniref:Type VII secretion-associated protein, Rv3446c family, C-terminal domain-containing protein n=1 Tax=Actinokineospora alba TaxID=504798 RepID=A0A1H0T211_9PSEU|nr:hypothetical protein [Actinokineospora alba]TDP66410.1 hypothetical protein C8E96_1917 [Actinokineospora alba]SDJ24434.1 hypothetical protein SAMN05421871_111151 [Actinokineospora alba]SDP47984.1 hypothetical protein SAMN05192558_109223 [Actinokineospora alba]